MHAVLLHHQVIPIRRGTAWQQRATALFTDLQRLPGTFELRLYAADSWFGWSSWDAGPARTQLRTSIMVTALAGIAVSYYFDSVNKSA